MRISDTVLISYSEAVPDDRTGGCKQHVSSYPRSHMNDPKPRNKRQQFSSPGWSMNVVDQAAMNGTKTYHADVCWHGVFRCRMTLGRKCADHAAAETALAVRVQDWLNGDEVRLGVRDSRASISSASVS